MQISCKYDDNVSNNQYALNWNAFTNEIYPQFLYDYLPKLKHTVLFKVVLCY